MPTTMLHTPTQMPGHVIPFSFTANASDPALVHRRKEREIKGGKERKGKERERKRKEKKRKGKEKKREREKEWNRKKEIKKGKKRERSDGEKEYSD